MENNNSDTEQELGKFFVVTVSVDQKQLQLTREQYIGDAANDEDLEEAVTAELGWITNSGLGLYIIEEVEPVNGTPILAELSIMYDGLEFEEKRIAIVPMDKNLKAWAEENIAAKFMPESEEPKVDNGGDTLAYFGHTYIYECGREVRLTSVKELSEADYHALKKYL